MSKLPFELMLALRYLQPKGTFVSVITLISIVGVSLGVAVLIIVISVMSGFDRQLREKILGFNAHVSIYQRDVPMQDFAKVQQAVHKLPQVESVAPFVMAPVMIKTQPPVGSSQIGAPWLRGVDPGQEGEVSVLPKSIIQGKYDLSGNGLLVGVEFARQLGLSVGDRISIYSPQALGRMEKSKGKDTAVLPDEYEIRGIFDVGYFQYNVSVIVCSLANAQDLYDLGDGVHGLHVMLKDAFKADEVQEQLAKQLGPDYAVTTWTMENSEMLDALVVEKHVMFYLLFFIIIVAAFGITSVLITFVVQKTREIGILKALGATSRQVMWLFLSQSLMVGILGVALGFGLGMLCVAYRNEFLTFMRHATNFELFPAKIYNFSELPALIVPGDIAVICGGSLVICILAGLLPALNAASLRPVEALRHE